MIVVTIENQAQLISIVNKERLKINACIDNIKIEYDDNIDKFTQEIVVNNIELLLNYCNR